MNELTALPFTAWYRAHLNEVAVLSMDECLAAYTRYLSDLIAITATICRT